MKTVITLAAEKAQWGKQKEYIPGLQRLLLAPFHVAQIAEVAMKGGQPVLQKIHVAADCGVVVNLSGAYQQVRGGVVDGLGHAMFGKLTFKDGAAEQKRTSPIIALSVLKKFPRSTYTS